MALFFPVVGGITAAITLALTYETGKNAKRKFDRKAKRGKRSID